MRKRFGELKDLIRKTITDLGGLNQIKLLCDAFEVYFSEHVLKTRNTPEEIKEVEDQFLFEMCQIINQHGDPVRVASILETVTSKCVSEGFAPLNQKIRLIIG